MSQSNGSTSTESNISVSEQSIVTTEPYSFSEVNTVFGPGPFSVNDLAKIFGEPYHVGGYYSEGNGYFVLVAGYNDMCIELAANNGEKLNFIVIDDSEYSFSHERYQVTSSDRDVRMKPSFIYISGGDFELPRKIKIGDSINDLYNAYNGNKGKQCIDEGSFLVAYDYGESGRITYAFETEEIDSSNKLTGVTIEWYDAYKWGDISDLSGVSGSSSFPPL